MQGWQDEWIDLIYVDPPFASNRQVVRRAAGGAGYDDRFVDLEAFVDFLQPRLREMHRLLKPTGTLYVHLDYRSAHYIKIELDRLFGRRNFLNEIIWHYRSGGRPGRWFARKHDTLLVYAKTAGQHTFHPQRDGQYRTRDMKHTADGRPFKTTRNGPIYFHPDGPAMTDVWDLPILSTIARERTPYPSQKPEALLDRVIACSSNPGDIVADVFCGSGTTLAVAKRLGRRIVGCDITEQAVSISRERLAAVQEKTGT